MHLYIHIPFCKQACYYCDFHFSTNHQLKSAMVGAICKEIELQQNYLSAKQLETIYLGGGTPSLLTESELDQIFQTIYQHFIVAPTAEITLEANPDDINSESLRMLKKYVNRLSIGIQSFHEPYLRAMNRAHQAQEGEESVKQAQDIGFENITIDLMYGFPKQNEHDIWQIDLEKAAALGVPHISAYNLTIEPDTVLGRWQQKGKFPVVSEEQSANEFQQMIGFLEEKGYEQYEISNFCKPNAYARHNTSYWQQKSYLGVGPSAHSFNQLSRQYNVANNALYIKALADNKIPHEIEILTIYDKINDYILTSLRTKWGCNINIIKELGGEEAVTTIYQTIKQYIESGMVILKEDTFYLTPSGKIFADKIASDLFLV